ncbi:MAG: glycerol kinase [Candidatus Marinimicrobia bacterium]|nr:glycerol kinase [Candidatus Neomarinimicrobiota bacterium]|tara:strand:+ start:2059 stop:3531 length:1473 start_codon:yes stop_codon:yes gene_type:complete
MKKYILSIDSGTTGVTTLLLDEKLKVVHKEYLELNQFFPNPGWVEHNPNELISKIFKQLNNIDKKYGLKNILSIGITNQRETIVLWDKLTGKPVYNAIVWQCRRTKDYCEKLKTKKTSNEIFKKTGLYIDSYFSATKIKWILENIPLAKKTNDKNQLLFGTIDTWIIWNLTNRKKHLTDYTNASRTMLYNINEKKWDSELLNLFKIPKKILPKIKNSMDNFGEAVIKKYFIPISGIAGDQQSALFGQGCYNKNTSKCTYGTGLFYLLNTGKIRQDSKSGLLTTLAIDENGKPCYAIEGSVFIGGAIIQWLRDELKLIKNASETEKIAIDIKDSNGVYIVPAFVGLGAPYWDSKCSGLITGITRSTNKKHIIRASLESIAYQVNDLIRCIQKDTKTKIASLNVDGGAANNNFLMQFQSDISNIKIKKPKNIETTAIGAGILAGIQSGFWKNTKEIFNDNNISKIFKPKMKNNDRNKRISGWNQSINRAIKQ